MLIEFKVKNFLSFEKEEVFNLVAGKGRTYNERLYKDKQDKILKFAAIFGANGSGKSNFVKAISFSQQYITQGNNRATIQKYYKLNSLCKESPSSFSYKIKIGEKTYTYGFEVILSKNEIMTEWLFANLNKSEELIFNHNRISNTFHLGKYFKNNELKNRLSLYADSLDSSNNNLFLNAISKYNNLFIDFPESNVLKLVFDWFLNKLKVKSPDSIVSDYAYFISDENMEDILKFFKDFDLSISYYNFIKCPKEQIALKLPKPIFDDLISNIEKALYSGSELEDNKVMFGLQDDFFIAKIIKDQISFETLQFYHENSNTPFSMYEESDGTKKIFKLLEILFQEGDVVYVVDEIDRCLHPLLTYNFINAFLEKAKTMNCQLIVTTHESLILDFRLLRKDEVRLISKRNGSSLIESLGDTKIRADKVLVKEYLLGEKGTPNMINNAYKY